MGLGEAILEMAPRYESVETIRERLSRMPYERVQDVERLRYEIETSMAMSEADGLRYTDEEIAYREMLIEMKVPIGPVQTQCDDWFLGFVLERHQRMVGV